MLHHGGMSSIYREEAINARHLEKLGVTLDLGGRLPFLVACLLLCVTLTAAWFAARAEYGRKIAVIGLIDGGQAKQVIASNFGEVAALHVREGGQVKAGAVLAQLKLPSGNRDLDAVLEELNIQLDRLGSQQAAIEGLRQQTALSLKRSIDSMGSQITLLDSDLALQAEKVEHLQARQEKIKVLHEQGMMSTINWFNYRTGLIAEQQKHNQLAQQKLDMRSRLEGAREELQRIGNETEEKLAAIYVQRSQIRKEREMMLSEMSQQIRAPVAGTVSRLDVGPGTTVVPGQSLMHIVAGAVSRGEAGVDLADARMTVSLTVPAAAAPHLQQGQNIQISVDALPVEKFGRLEARVMQLAPHAVLTEDKASRYFPARLVIAPELAQTFGDGNLLPGMTIKTYVRTDRKRIINWLLDPVKKLFDQVNS